MKILYTLVSVTLVVLLGVTGCESFNGKQVTLLELDEEQPVAPEPEPKPVPTPEPGPGHPSRIIEIASDREYAEWRQKLKDSEEKEKAVILFSADWCGYCQQLKNSGKLEKLVERNEEVYIFIVDIDRCRKVKQLNTTGVIPTVRFKDRFFTGSDINVSNLERYLNAN